MSAGGRLHRRVLNLAIHGVTTAPLDEGGSVGLAQVQVNSLQTLPAVPHVGMFGFQSSPPVGTDVVHMSIAGDLSNGMIVASNHQGSRMKGLPPGGSRQHDASGCQVLMRNDGAILIGKDGETLRRLVTEIAMAVYNGHTHPCPGGHTGVPDQQMDASALTTATKAGT